MFAETRGGGNDALFYCEICIKFENADDGEILYQIFISNIGHLLGKSRNLSKMTSVFKGKLTGLLEKWHEKHENREWHEEHDKYKNGKKNPGGTKCAKDSKMRIARKRNRTWRQRQLFEADYVDNSRKTSQCQNDRNQLNRSNTCCVRMKSEKFRFFIK